MIGFHFNRSIPTTLKLNGPTLAYLTQPVDTSESITGFATFTGIATATYPSSPGDIIEGTFEFHWYLDNTEIFNSSGIAIVSSGNISTCTFSNIPSTSDGKLVKIITDYIPGTNESNAINDDLNSDSATLTLIPGIQIITQPQSVEVATGNDTVFSVGAQLEDGTTDNLFYQWYVDNQPIIDGVSSGYTYSGSGTSTLTVNVGNDVSIDKDVYVEVSNPQSYNSPLNSNIVSMSIVAPRPIIKYEAYTFNNQYQSLDIDFNNNSLYSLDSNTFGSTYSIIQFHSTEKNNILNIEMYASKGTNNGGYSGGNGGLSTIKFTAVKDIEYTLIGISNNSSLFLYRGSNLIACVGAGGNAGTSGNGGDGGGINIPGSDGGGRQGGVGGTKINTGTLSLSGTYGSIYENSGIELYPGDSVANSPDGGKTISCTKGSYWIDQGIAPCSDNSSSDIKFVNVDGTTISDSSLLKRGFKPGYTISNTSGLEINNGGRGGSGATGGGGGTSGSGGGGGSGYTDGSVIVATAVLGGSTGSSKVVMRVEDTEFIHFFDNTVRPKRTTSLTSTGNIVNISAQSENSGGPPGDLNSKHYLITMDADYTGLTIEVISDLTAAGGSSDPDMTAASIQKQNSTQWRVWFVRGNGTSNTFVREASIIGNV
mgnify:FL=1